MKKPHPPSPPAAELRQGAQDQLRAAPAIAATDEDALHQHRELQVHQVEVRLQNEELAEAERIRLSLLDLIDGLKLTQASLRASEANMAEAQRIGHFGSWELDLIAPDDHHANPLRWSDEVFRIFGLDASDFGATYAAFLTAVHPEDRDRMEAAHLRVLSGEDSLSLEHRIVRPDGTVRWVRELGELRRDATGRATHLTGTVLDITERRTIEAERDNLFNHSEDLLCVGSFDGRFVLLNPAWNHLLGWSVAEMQSRPWLDFVHPDDQEATLRAQEHLVQGQSVRGLENRFRCKDGSYRWLAWNSHPLMEARQIFGVVRDITERKRADEALQRSAALLRIAGQAAHLGGWTLDPWEQKLTWSDETFRIHDLPPGTPPTLEEAIGFYPPEYRDLVQRHVRACIAEGLPFDFELELITAKRRRIWIRAIGEAVRGADGRITQVQGAFQDISEQKAAIDKARSSAERLAQTLESITDGFFTLDRDWGFVYVNAEAERILSCPRSALLGRSIWEAYPDAVGSTFDREYRRAVATNTTVIFEEHYPALEIWCEVRAFPSAEGLAVYFRDVTERRRISEALRTSESKFRQLAQSNILGILFWDAEGQVSDANDAFLQMVGYTREDLAGGRMDWRSMTPPELWRQDERALAEIAASGSCTPFEKEYLHKAGHRVAVLIGAAALDGAKDQGICYVVDISLQKQAEATLRVSEERFRLLAKATNDAIWDWDLGSDQLWWNEGYETLFGYARAQADPNSGSWTDLIHPEDAARVITGIQRVIAQGGLSWSDEYRFRRKDGSYAHVLDRGHVIRDAAAKPLRMIGGMTDLTKVKAHEIALSQSNRALQLLSRCNEALIRSETESGLLVDICQTAVDVGRFRLAWVGYALDDANKSIVCQSHAGVEDGYLAGLRTNWAENDPLGRSPAGKVIRTGEPVVIPDIETDEAFRPWREPALARGFRGVIALPLADKTRTFGVLVLYLPEARQPLPDEMRLLRELANDMAFGIGNIRTRIDRQRIQAAVEQVAAAVSAATSENFFEQLARNMALAVGAYGGFVAKLLPGEPMIARTVAAVVGSQVADNFDYVIEGTPCETFFTTDECVIHRQVADQFPRSPSLAALGAQGYVGRRLDSSAGKFLGLLFVVFREPLKEADFVTTTLRIFAARAAAELERAQTDAQVREQAALLDKAQDAILVRDLDHRITYLNSSAERLFGWSASQALGRSVRELLYTEPEIFDLATTQLLARGEWTGELRHQRKDGRIIDIEGRWTLVRDAADQPKAILDISTDITERKRADEALRKSEASLINAQSRAKIGNWELDLATKTGTWSAEMFRLFERDPALGVPTFAEFETLIHHEDRASFTRLQAESLAAGRGHEQDFRVVLPDGALRWTTARSELILDEAGQPARLIGTSQDITERKRHEARFRRIVESNVQGVHFWNLDGRITDANDAFLRLTGRSREDLEAGRLNFHSLTPPDWAEADRRALVQLNATGVCDPFEKEYERPDGTRVPVLLGAAFFEDQPDEGVAFVVDLTERKKLEQQFLRAQRMEGIGTLASGIAHDLNNALGPIILSLDLLKMSFPDAASQELLAIVATSAQRGADMVRQVLSFARGVEGRRMQVHVRHLLREIEKILRDTFPKDIEVRTIVPPELWTVLGDPTQLHQVLLNLCVNARDAMPSGGVLMLSAQDLTIDAHYSAMNPEAHPGPYVLLQVEDSGTGMSAEVMSKAFDPFFTTKELGKGTGLGLSTSMGIVRSHGGFIRVYSEPGKGTTFKVYLPAVAQRSPAMAAEQAAELPRGNGELILVVDDEASVRQITQQTLEAFGYRVIVAADGAEALATHAREGAAIAVVLTDMMMPIMDGPTAIQELRRANPAVRIIGASGLSAHGHVARVANLGVKHFLPKPYTAEALLKTLKEVLS